MLRNGPSIGAWRLGIGTPEIMRIAAGMAALIVASQEIRQFA